MNIAEKRSADISRDSIDEVPGAFAAFSLQYYLSALGVLARGWKTLAIYGVIGMLLGVFFAHFGQPIYTAELVVRPSTSAKGRIPGLPASLTAAMSGQLGGGDFFTGADQGSFDQFVALLDSNELSQTLVQRHPEILHNLFPGNWNEEKHVWQRSGLRAAASDAMRNLLGMPPWHPPTGEDLRAHLASTMAVSTDIKTGMVTIQYRDKDPESARDTLMTIYRTADDLVREQERQRSASRIAYLEKLLPSVTQSELHEVLVQLYANEERQLMTVRADQYFATSPVDLPIVPQNPSSTSPKIVVIGFTLFGAILGSVLLLLGVRLPFARPLRWGRNLLGSRLQTH